jgi:pimeloyl-ACP methyl ester carboxylesterase
MPYLQREDASLYYQVYGTGQPLVFLHGKGGNSLSWWQQVDFFARRYQCILLDLRGFGRSQGRADRFSTYETDLLHVLDALQIDSFLAIGHSLGGAVLGSFCQTFPGRVQAAVFSCSYGSVQLPSPLNELFWTALSQLPAKFKAWKSDGRHHPALSSRFGHEQPSLARLFEWLAGLNPPLPPSPDVAEAPVRPDALPRYTLFITGAEDEVVPPEVVRGAAALVPTSRFEVVPESGHSPYFEQASLYNRVVDEFLQQKALSAEKMETRQST